MEDRKAGCRRISFRSYDRREDEFSSRCAVAAPQGMVYASGGRWVNFIAFVGSVIVPRMAPYYIDRYEVTNRQYQEFVDKGGYEKREYWTTPFTKDGHQLNWEDAKAFFRDSSGRAGPSTWQGGHYPEGQADFPVSGVSWYEASAYAAFAGRACPPFPNGMRLHLPTWAVTPFRKVISPLQRSLPSEHLRDWGSTAHTIWLAT